MTIKPDFSSAQLKIKRANEHLLDVEKWCALYNDLNPCEARIEIDPKTGQTTGHLAIFGPKRFAQSESLACIIGDTVHNLRAALDHAASAILVACGEDPECATFPLDKNRQSLIAQPRYIKIQRLSPELANIIANKVCTGDAADFLVGMNHIDRADKHRLVITAVATAEGRILCIADENDPSDFPINTFLVLPAGRMPSIGSQAHAHNERNRKLAVFICFGPGEVFENKPVIPTLHHLLQLVTGIIHELDSFAQPS